MKQNRKEELMKIKKIYTMEDLLILLSMSISTINRWSAIKEPPVAFRRKRTIRYHYDDFLVWCKEMDELERIEEKKD